MEPFEDAPAGGPAVHAFLHRPATPSGDALVLTHGAGSDCRAPLLVGIASAFAARGFLVLRSDLPFRRARSSGPPPLSAAAHDRDGLRRAVLAIRKLAPGRVFLGGHSYGGRQATILAAEEPDLAAGLLLLSYPLHPPRRPRELRTAHFPRLRVRALFVHGSRDPFGSLDEMRSALALIPAPTVLVPIEGGTHDLSRRPRGPAPSVDAGAATLAAFIGLMG